MEQPGGRVAPAPGICKPDLLGYGSAVYVKLRKWTSPAPAA